MALDNLYAFPSEREGTQIKLNFKPLEDFPFVSVLTPTYNRKWFMDLMIRNWKVMDYPDSRREWIILDDSQSFDKALNWDDFKRKCFENNIPVSNIRFFRMKKRMYLGEKRNFLASLARGTILIHYDDDDYYPPESVVARVKALVQSGKACVGCTRTLCYDLLYDQTFEAFDPVSPSDPRPCTISESTLGYTKEFWKTQKFNKTDTKGECLALIEGRHSEIVTLPYVFVVTQLSHSLNTVTRRVAQNTKHTAQFLSRIPMKDYLILQSLKIEVIKNIPLWKEAIDMVSKHAQLSKRAFIRKVSKTNPELLRNPFVIQHLKTYVTKSRSSGKDICFVCAPGQYLKFDREWNGSTEGLGGSEEAVVALAETWAKRGYEVTVYNTCTAPIIVNGVKYLEYWKWSPFNSWNVTILWRDPSLLDESHFNSDKVLLDLHDVIDSGWLTEDRLSKVDWVMCKSEYHRSLIGNEKVQVIPNGIHSKPFLKETSKTPFQLMATSSPDRCLVALLDALPLIRKEFPTAKVCWAYGFSSGVTKDSLETNVLTKDWVKGMKRRISETEGFEDLGRVSHKEILKLSRRSNLFVYGTVFPEIDCISVTKAMAAGTVPIMTLSGALKEKAQFCDNKGIAVKERTDNGTLDYSVKGEKFAKWVQNIIEALRQPIDIDKRRKMKMAVAKNYDWKKIASQWEECFD